MPIVEDEVLYMNPKGLGNLELSDDENELSKAKTRGKKKVEKLKIPVPACVKFLMEILTKKRPFNDVETVTFPAECNAALQINLSPKLKDPGSFSIPCHIGSIVIDKALCDWGASVSVMLYSICKKLNMGQLRVTNMTLQMASRSLKRPLGVLEDVPVRVGK
ncbi:uncharacterized protein LOC141651928 [Silene latifolia]|uniref:uncharacterized protein LOC141651928 n=1 Tax=Silene latifolia TaxID=37657 RepID=UPI003D78265C